MYQTVAYTHRQITSRWVLKRSDKNKARGTASLILKVRIMHVEQYETDSN